MEQLAKQAELLFNTQDVGRRTLDVCVLHLTSHILRFNKMRKERFELSRLSPYASETYAYTNSATSALLRSNVFTFELRSSKLYEAILVKLAGTVLPRLNELSGPDGDELFPQPIYAGKSKRK